MKSSIQDSNNQQDNTQQNNLTQQSQRSGIKAKKKPIQAKQKTIQTKQNPFQAKQAPIQAKQRPVQRNTGSGSASSNTNEAQIKANVSALTGTDVTDAKVHYNSDKPAQLQAEATAQGNQVHLATGKEQHLGHELTHVAQQKQGRVKPTIQANNGVGINNDPKLEKEADDIGAQAQSGKPIQAKSIQSANFNGGQQPVQAKFQNDSNNPMEQGYLTGDEASKVILGFKKSGFYRLILKESKIKNNSPALIDQILNRIAEGKDNKSTLKVSKDKDNNSYDNLANYGLVYKKAIELVQLGLNK